jgi:hypothetical protein
MNESSVYKWKRALTNKDAELVYEWKLLYQDGEKYSFIPPQKRIAFTREALKIEHRLVVSEKVIRDVWDRQTYKRFTQFFWDRDTDPDLVQYTSIHGEELKL